MKAWVSNSARVSPYHGLQVCPFKGPPGTTYSQVEARVPQGREEEPGAPQVTGGSISGSRVRQAPGTEKKTQESEQLMKALQTSSTGA